MKIIPFLSVDEIIALFSSAKCIDEYIRQRATQVDGKAKKGQEQEQHEVPVRALETLVDKIFERSYEMGEYKYALGIALEARRVDRIEETIKKSGDLVNMLNYCFRVAMEVISRDFRQTVTPPKNSFFSPFPFCLCYASPFSATLYFLFNNNIMQVLGILVPLYRGLEVPDWIRVCEILIFLDNAQEVAAILCNLLTGTEVRVTFTLIQLFGPALKPRLSIIYCLKTSSPFLKRMIF